MCKVGRMRNRLVGLLAALGVFLMAPGCGDNSRACGPGTVEEEGYCVPAATCGFGTKAHEETGECIPDGSVVCSDGTVFDVLTGQCKIDETACQNGTVLVEDACVDPTAELVIDVQEGPEPNGLGVLEASEAQAGNIVLKASDPFVLHGTIDPHRDSNNDGALDPDVDTYVITIGAPVFVKITADGVNGTAAGFVALAVVDPMTGAGAGLETWKRVGMSLVSDTAIREVYLPKAGRYWLAIADTRTLIDYVTTGTSTSAPGGDTSEYYVSLTPFTPAPPEMLTLTNGRITTTRTKTSEQLALFTAPLGTGLNVIDLSMTSALVHEALVLRARDEFHSALETDGAPVRAFVGGLDEGDDNLIIVDSEYTLLPTTVTYTLGVVSVNATPLSETGGTVTAPAKTSVGTDFTYLNQFSFEALEDLPVALDLTWSPGVVGQVYDSSGQVAASFTSPTSASIWTSFRGLLRFGREGRYYFVVFAPSATSTSSVSVTSSIDWQPSLALTQGTPLTQALDTYGVRSFHYDAGTADAWQQFDITGTNTGGQEATWFDDGTAWGRLDPLSTSTGTRPPDPTPVFGHTYAATGGPIGRVLLSDPSQQYLVKVDAVSPATNPSVTLSFDRRAAMSDLGTVTSTASRTGETISSSTPQRFYLFRAAIGTTVTITVTPTSNVNTQFRRLNADESPLGPLVNTANNGADVETFTQTGTEWTAFAVSSAGPLSASRTFTVSILVQ